MKKAILSLLILLNSSFMFAQNKKANTVLTPEEKAQNKTNQLHKLVNLNETQKNNSYLIYLKEELKYIDDSKNYVPNSKEAQNAEKERKEYVDTHLKLVLDENQYSRLMEYRKSKIAKRKTSETLFLENDI